VLINLVKSENLTQGSKKITVKSGAPRESVGCAIEGAGRSTFIYYEQKTRLAYIFHFEFLRPSSLRNNQQRGERSFGRVYVCVPPFQARTD
jgi:hypothetical protein